MVYNTYSPIPPEAFILIIGAMKAGTTTLYGHLAAHPKICPPRMKEPDFFLQEKLGTLGDGSYEKLWRFDPAQHSFAIEASTGYAKHFSDAVPKKIKHFGLQPKLIYILRDPFERIQSEYNFMKRFDPNWPWDIDTEGSVISSDYMHFIDIYEEVFGLGSVYVIDFDDLVQQPLETVNNILKELGLIPFETLVKDKVENATVSRSPLESRLIGPFRPLINIMPTGLRDSFKAILRPVLSQVSHQPAYVRLTNLQRAKIKETLAPGMVRLAQRTGIDISKWGF